MAFYGFKGIGGATWMETALAAEPGAQHQAISLDNKYQDAFHFLASFCQCLCRLRRSSPFSAVAASRLAMTTISMGGRFAVFKRNDSRTCRLIRLRPTAVAETLRDTASPSRGCPCSFTAASRVKKRSEERKPSRNTRANASGFSRRRRRGNRKSLPGSGFAVTDRAGPGPWRGVRSEPCDRPWSPCARGSRGSAYDEGCLAGTFFS